MKIVVALISISVFSAFPSYETTPRARAAVTLQPSEGEKIVAKQDCATCHKVDKKLIGPSYLDIAKKYPNNDKSISYLADKIIKGGSGVWGAIPMAAHSKLSKEEAKKIASYIMTLKK